MLVVCSGEHAAVWVTALLETDSESRTHTGVSSSFRSSDGHFILCDESSSTPQVLQAAIELPNAAISRPSH